MEYFITVVLTLLLKYNMSILLPLLHLVKEKHNPGITSHSYRPANVLLVNRVN